MKVFGPKGGLENYTEASPSILLRIIERYLSLPNCVTIIIKGRPIYAEPNDINNNKESSVKKVVTLEKQTPLYPLHSKKKAVRQDSGSDWSDFDVTL